MGEKIELKVYTELETALACKKEVVSVYGDTYSLPPYNESDEGIRKFGESWKERVENKGFILVIAYVENIAAGMAYGWKSESGSYWNIKLSSQLGNESEKWLSDCFEFVDIAVSPNFQGRGIGGKLYKAIFNEVPNKSALLYTHQSDTGARKMYLKYGWEELRDNLILSSGKKFVLMGKGSLK